MTMFENMYESSTGKLRTILVYKTCILQSDLDALVNFVRVLSGRYHRRALLGDRDALGGPEHVHRHLLEAEA